MTGPLGQVPGAPAKLPDGPAIVQRYRDAVQSLADWVRAAQSAAPGHLKRAQLAALLQGAQSAADGVVRACEACETSRAQADAEAEARERDTEAGRDRTEAASAERRELESQLDALEREVAVLDSPDELERVREAAELQTVASSLEDELLPEQREKDRLERAAARVTDLRNECTAKKIELDDVRERLRVCDDEVAAIQSSLNGREASLHRQSQRRDRLLVEAAEVALRFKIGQRREPLGWKRIVEALQESQPK